jgi:TRAP-type C4-dicarboxylate transport system permease large subunit
MFLDPVGIILLVMPIFFPVILKLGFDPIWYGVLFQINLCMGYITPPFGYNIFYVKTLSPDTPIGVIYASVFPFVLIMIFSVLVMTYVPSIIMWLPNVLLAGK